MKNLNTAQQIELARNENTSAEILDKLADINNEDLNFALVFNKNTSVKTLNKIANFDNEELQRIVKDKLSNIDNKNNQEKSVKNRNILQSFFHKLMNK